MTLDAHRITAEQVRALGSGTNSQAELAVLAASQRSKTLATLAEVVRRAVAADHPEAPAAIAGWELLARVQRESPAAFESVIRHPSVGAWATEAVSVVGAAGHSAGPPGHLALVAAAAAIRGGVACSAELPPSLTAGPELHVPALGSAILPPTFRGEPLVLGHHGHVTEVNGKPGAIELPGELDGAAPHWRPLAQVTAESGGMRVHLVIDDADPYRLPRSRLPLSRVSDDQRSQWSERIAAAWHLLASHHQPVAADIATLIGTLTPLGGAAGAVHSITSRRAFGSIGLSSPADDVSLALTLAHEVQHAKLYALMDLLPLLAGDPPDLYYAPWRADPRPLANLIQGMYAHLGVTRFWWRQREVAKTAAEVHRAHAEFFRWRSACTQAARVISVRPELTRYGAVFMEGVWRALREWKDETGPAAAWAEAIATLAEHLRSWDASSTAPKRLGENGGTGDG
jgi:HEXXH motif-containing protein